MALSRSEMENILGPLDHQLAAEILTIDPTADELARAYYWANADEAMVADNQHMPSGKVARLLDVLRPEPDADGPGARPSDSAG